MKIFEKQDLEKKSFDKADNFITGEKIKKLLKNSIMWDRETLERQEEFDKYTGCETKEKKIKKLIEEEVGKGRIIDKDEFYMIYEKITKLERLK